MTDEIVIDDLEHLDEFENMLNKLKSIKED